MFNTKEIQQSIQSLLKRLAVPRDGLVVVRDDRTLNPYNSKIIFETINEYLNNGTFVVIGDCSLNTNVLGKGMNYPFSNQERIVMTSSPLLQIMTLSQECAYSSHPSLTIAAHGKFAKYFGRSVTLDFPYGEDSIFKDFCELNGILIILGDNAKSFEARHALSGHENAVISKTTCYKDSAITGYLDFAPIDSTIEKKFLQTSIPLSEKMGDRHVYGTYYNDYLEYYKKELQF